MAQDRTAALEAQLLAGARGVQNKKENMLERLAKMFTATDLVTITNIMDEQFGWVYTDPRETTYEQPNSSTKRVNFGEPKTRILQAGEKKTIPGWEAYIALNRMWKMWAQRDPQNVSFVLQSVEDMDSFLRQAYQGIFDPNTVGATSAADLGFEVPEQPVVSQDRTAAAEQTVQAPVAPTADPGLGFSDEDKGDDQPQNVLPPMQDPTQPDQPEGNDAGSPEQSLPQQTPVAPQNQ